MEGLNINIKSFQNFDRPNQTCILNIHRHLHNMPYIQLTLLKKTKCKEEIEGVSKQTFFFLKMIRRSIIGKINIFIQHWNFTIPFESFNPKFCSFDTMIPFGSLNLKFCFFLFQRFCYGVSIRRLVSFCLNNSIQDFKLEVSFFCFTIFFGCS